MPSLMSAVTRKFITSRSAPRPPVLLVAVKETVGSVSWVIGVLLLRVRVLGHQTPLTRPHHRSALLARSAHNLVVEAVDLRLDPTTLLAGPVIKPAVDLLLGRLQVTA